MGMQTEASLSKERTQSKQGTEEERAAPAARRGSKGTALLPHLDSVNSGTCRAVENSAKAPPQCWDVPCACGGSQPHTLSTSVHPEPSQLCLTPQLGSGKAQNSSVGVASGEEHEGDTWTATSCPRALCHTEPQPSTSHTKFPEPLE